MRKLTIILAILVGACNSNQKSKQEAQPDLNGLSLDAEIVIDIEQMTDKSFERNFVVRYQAADSGTIYEPYDSLVPGLRIRFVRETTAYEIIDKHFKSVRDSKNYLYLTNLDFDDAYRSHYDVVIAPIQDQFELIAFVGTEPVNYGLSTLDVVEWFRKKRSEFDFDIIVADLDRIEARLNSSPKDFQQLGNDIYEFCPDVIEQGHSDMDELVDYLQSERRMWFWWD